MNIKTNRYFRDNWRNFFMCFKQNIAQPFLKKQREKSKNENECPEILHPLKIIKWLK